MRSCCGAAHPMGRSQHSTLHPLTSPAAWMPTSCACNTKMSAQHNNLRILRTFSNPSSHSRVELISGPTCQKRGHGGLETSAGPAPACNKALASSLFRFVFLCAMLRWQTLLFVTCVLACIWKASASATLLGQCCMHLEGGVFLQ
jgi:hypothetical protein